MIFIKNLQILEEKNFILFYFILFFSCYYCSINLKRQSEHSGLRPDTSSLVCLIVFVLFFKRIQQKKLSTSNKVGQNRTRTDNIIGIKVRNKSLFDHLLTSQAPHVEIFSLFVSAFFIFLAVCFMCAMYVDAMKDLRKMDEADTFENLNPVEFGMIALMRAGINEEQGSKTGGDLYYIKSSQGTWVMAMAFLALFVGITACIVICVCACCCSDK